MYFFCAKRRIFLCQKVYFFIPKGVSTYAKRCIFLREEVSLCKSFSNSNRLLFGPKKHLRWIIPKWLPVRRSQLPPLYKPNNRPSDTRYCSSRSRGHPDFSIQVQRSEISSRTGIHLPLAFVSTFGIGRQSQLDGWSFQTILGPFVNDFSGSLLAVVRTWTFR